MDDLVEKFRPFSRSYYWKRVGFLHWECWVLDGGVDRRVLPARFLTWRRAAKVSNAIFEAYNDGAGNQRRRDQLAREKVNRVSDMVRCTSELRDLALRCMQGVGPDLELNAMIEVAVGEADQVWNNVFVSRDSGADRLARDYTGSMDVAISLMPKGCVVDGLGRHPDNMWFCDVRHPALGDSREGPFTFTHVRASAPSLALAAAALEARAAMMEADRE